MFPLTSQDKKQKLCTLLRLASHLIEIDAGAYAAPILKDVALYVEGDA